MFSARTNRDFKKIYIYIKIDIYIYIYLYVCIYIFLIYIYIYIIVSFTSYDLLKEALGVTAESGGGGV